MVFLCLLGILFVQSIYVINCTADEKIILKSSDVHGEGYPTIEAVKYMGKLLKKWTNLWIFGSIVGIHQNHVALTA